MPKAIIFDLNGVFIQSPKLSDRFKEELGVSRKIFMTALNATLLLARMPHAPDVYELWKPYLDTWKVNLSRDNFLHFWFNAEGGNKEMVALAEELKNKGIKLFILSNNFRERSLYYAENFPFFTELFDKIYYSWQTGFLKSNRRAYEIVLEENNLKPEEVMFFDDSKENVLLANSLGIKSFLFKDVKDVREKVEEKL